MYVALRVPMAVGVKVADKDTPYPALGNSGAPGYVEGVRAKSPELPLAVQKFEPLPSAVFSGLGKAMVAALRVNW